MSELLLNVQLGAELHLQSHSEFHRAIVRAKQGGESLRKIAAATRTTDGRQLSFSGVAFIVKRETEREGKP